MFCPSCGSQVADNISFCPKCGAKLKETVCEKKDNTVVPSGRAETVVQDNYTTLDGTTVIEYLPYNKFKKSTVCVDNFYVTVDGNSIDRAHISGTKQCCRMHKGAPLVIAFAALATLGFFSSGDVLLAIFFAVGTVLLFLFGREYSLIIKGAGSADAIYVTVDFRNRKVLDTVESAVKALAISHDNDTNVRAQGAMNRAHAEYQADRIIDAINRK